MEDLYGTAQSSGTGLASESEDITNILNQLLQSSSPPPFSSAPATASFTGFKAKYAHLFHSPQSHHHTASFSGAAEGLLGSEDRLRFGRSENRTEPEPSSGFGFSDPSGGFFGAEAKEGAENAFSDANTSLKDRRVSPENDLGDFSCDSEGPEASDVPSNSAPPPRSSSKRSRAAEVHNLSEKRRRSRINEKMKALQTLFQILQGIEETHPNLWLNKKNLQVLPSSLLFLGAGDTRSLWAALKSAGLSEVDAELEARRLRNSVVTRHSREITGGSPP